MTMRIRRQAAAGLTLIEVLVALIVFSIGALGVLGMVTITLHLNQNSRQTTEATQLGIRQMERLQVIPTSSADFTSCGTLCYLAPALTGSTTAQAIRPADLLGGTAGSALFYQVTWRNTSSTGGLRYLEVVVYWPKDRDLAGADWSGSVDCQADPERCYSVEFHSYRQP